MKPFIIANWKMHFSLAEAVDICFDIISQDLQHNLIIATPAPYLAYLSNKFESIKFCAQNVSHFADPGAYTGEFSAMMLKSSNIDYAVIGHSERRNIFSETNELIAQKVRHCIQNRVTPIICIGESLFIRDKYDYKTFLTTQLINSIADLSLIQQRFIIAYEPIWSIGTDMIPTNEQLIEIFTHLHSICHQTQIANNINLVYGGSVNLNNIQQILNIPYIQGVLIGKAALDSGVLSQMLKNI
ncbi:triose-phosphate isomerase [Candidatus Trichorickettsia mobilis]|uniref:triose-phosphate isomerase n=1 Tax=Candidatus Trichorickettsia mobilis TaxID=1346319 RepID=UPI00292FF61E|nr:triose-phosphate isomerase family protein [Candidatus Trichorickettsia mobilis]